jgi:ketosteroid isomerase-like protein
MRLAAAVVGPCLAISIAAQTPSPALQAIVDTERAFARASVDHGQREAFLTYLADDGITFSPHPGTGKEAIRKRAAPANPKEFTLNWSPLTGGASSSGDYGFTTGPYIVEDNSQHRPTRHGMYFTIWRKQADGAYRAVLDAGIVTPEPVAPVANATFTPMPGVGTGDGRPANRAAASASLQQADAAFSQVAQERGMARAGQQFIRDDGRLHRNGHGPIIGRTQVDAFLSEQVAPFSGETIFVSVSRAADFGYTYGRYQLKGREKGYYVRLWTRDPGRDWKVLLDTTSPLPAP